MYSTYIGISRIKLKKKDNILDWWRVIIHYYLPKIRFPARLQWPSNITQTRANKQQWQLFYTHLLILPYIPVNRTQTELTLPWGKQYSICKLDVLANLVKTLSYGLVYILGSTLSHFFAQHCPPLPSTLWIAAAVRSFANCPLSRLFTLPTTLN